MPRLNGFQATRQMRHTPSLVNTAIIAISAGAFAQDRWQCIEAGANDFVAKPFREDKLLAVLCANLDLTLVYADDKPAVQSEGAETLVVPDEAQLRTLLDSASRGDIKSFLEQLNQLEATDPAYAPFVQQLRIRAAGYRMKELRRWLKAFEHTDECVAR
jgi:PleD family two-component response regulator